MYNTRIIVLVGVLGIGVTSAHATIGPITPASGYNITWNSNEGLYLNGPVPDNVALASNGSTPFTSGDLGSGHITADINDGSYGNASSWIHGGAIPNPPNQAFFGVVLPASLSLTNFAFGRDNTTGGQTDRFQATYTIQFTTDAVVNTSGGGTWTTIGTVVKQAGGGGSPGEFPWLRHAFDISTDLGDPIVATGFRILTDTSSIAIDELELYDLAAVPEPSTIFLLMVGGTLVYRRFRRA